MHKNLNAILDADAYDRVQSPLFLRQLRVAHEKGLLPGILEEAGLQEFERTDQSGLFPTLHRGLDHLQITFERARHRVSA